MKILIADDSKTHLHHASDLLERLGHEVLSATTSEAVLKFQKNNAPDLIILDMTLEGGSGFECAHQIRQNNPDWIPIIFLCPSIDDKIITKGLEAGGDDFLTHPISEMALAAKIKTLQHVIDMRERLLESINLVTELSSRDSLTGTFNRSQFEKVLEEKIEIAKKHKEKIALLFLDLDNFKTVNDSFGHPIGDLLLKEITERFKEVLKPGDILARIGGDEFGIILTNLEDIYLASLQAQKILDSLIEPFVVASNQIYITASIGIGTLPPANDYVSLIQQSAIAMNYVKKLQGNTFQAYNKELNNIHKERHNLENALKSALTNNELFLTYQPIFNIQTMQLEGMEVLTCWKQPDLGLISPTIFIPIAEEIGLIDVIGQWILETACLQAAKWYKMGFDNFKISVNVSPKQLLQKKLVPLILTVLNSTELPAKLLCLEITETASMTQHEYSKKIIQEIHHAGISIAIDDFGTGYSSLNHLKYFPINTVKIEKSFIHDITSNPNDAMIVKSIITLGKNIGFNIVAEGIETPEQLEYLINIGCPQGQGFYLQKALSPKGMTDLLKQQSQLKRK